MFDTLLLPAPTPPAPTPAPLTRPNDAATVYERILNGRNANTIRAYGNTYEDFAAYLKTPTTLDAIQLLFSRSLGEANALVEGYKGHMIDRKLAPKTVNARLGAIRSLCRLGYKFGVIPWRLEVGNERSRDYRDTSGPGADKYKLLLEKLKERIAERGGLDPVAQRDIAMIRLLYNPALRRFEVANLDLEHIDFDQSRARIIGKGHRESEWITLPPNTLAAIRDWINVRGDQPGPLFISLDPGATLRDTQITEKRRVCGRTVWQRVKFWGQQIGIELRPHKLRHGGATAVARASNGNAMAVKAFGRWKRLDTAQTYVDNDKNLAGQAARLIDEE